MAGASRTSRRVLWGALLVAALALPSCSSGATAPASPPASSSAPSAGAPSGNAGTAPTTAGVTAPAAPATVAPLSPAVKVRAGMLALLTEAGIFIAQERGYFREEGLDVELIRFARGGEQTPLLATGGLDFGVGAPDSSLFNAAARDVPLKMVSPNAVSNRDDSAGWLAVRQGLVDSGRFKELNDLRGMRLAVNGGFSIATVRLERMLEMAQLSQDDVEVSVIPYPDMFAALSNGAIDAGISAEPFVTAGKLQRIASPFISMNTVYPGVILQAVTVSPVFAKDQPEATRRFVTAHLRGQRDYARSVIRGEGGKDEIIQVLMQYTDIKDRDILAQMGTHGIALNGDIDEAVLDDLQDHFLRYGVQQQRVDSSKVVDHSYMDYALQRLGRMPQ
jgi:ABC-type nitrate/sulfonate/bicarbonate transport system substrate-binding protein